MKKQDIKLEVIDDKIKVTSPYNTEFVEKARNFRGKWKDGAWWFDDSIIDYVRETMIEIFGTSGEEDYKLCRLLIKDYTDSEERGPVTLFGRTIARARGRDSGAKLGDDIVFIEGNKRSGGSAKNWSTNVENATFEIQNFPYPRTQKEDVQNAIKEGWCEIIDDTKNNNGIKELDGTSNEVYQIIGPYAMDRNVIREVDNPITTNENNRWFLLYNNNELVAFCSVEYTKTSMTIKNFYAIDRHEDHKYDLIDHIMKIFKNEEINKLYCFFKTSQLKKAKKTGFKTTSLGKNWHRLVIEK